MRYWHCLGGVLVTFAVPLIEIRRVLALLVFKSVFQNFLLQITSIMATPVSNVTNDEAHAEFSRLVQRITNLDEELQSGKFGNAGCETFNQKVHELAVLFSRVSQLCKRLNILMPKALWQMPYFKHWSKSPIFRLRNLFSVTVVMQLHRTL